MAISAMYPAMPGSPKTRLTEEISASATSMTVYDASVLPDAPNVCVIGDDENAEVVGYNSISGNVVSGLVRALGNTTASVWPAETDVARNYTSFDHDRFIENIKELDNTKLDSVAWGDIGGTLSDQTDLQTALDAKQGTLTFDSTPTNGSNNPVKSSGIYDAFAKEIMQFTSVAVGTSTSTGTQIMRIPASGTNSNITTDTVVLSCIFASPDNVTSDVTWQSYAGYVRFAGTCTAATTATVILGTKGN